jgi:hypothetical protein
MGIAIWSYGHALFVHLLSAQGCYMSVQHQYNATYFSACKEDPQLYLLARALQFFTPLATRSAVLHTRRAHGLLRGGSKA